MKSQISSTREQRLREARGKIASIRQNTNQSYVQNKEPVLSRNPPQDQFIKQQQKAPVNNSYTNEIRARNKNSDVNKSFDLKSMHQSPIQASMLPVIQTGRSRRHIPPCPYAEAKTLPSMTPAKNATKSRNLNHPPTTMSEKKNVRPLPIHNRQDVFDEWGAILKHQDEIDHKLQQQQAQKMKQRQINYK